MNNVFLSYANEDTQRAETIANALQEKGFSVWWDRRIVPGKEFDYEIEKAIEDSRCVVVLWSKYSIKSKWVRDEANKGLERNMLIPATIDLVIPPMGFRSIQTADLTNWKNLSSSPGFITLLKAISEFVKPNKILKSSEIGMNPVYMPPKPSYNQPFNSASKALPIKIIVLISVLALSLITITIFFGKSFFTQLWEYDPFLVYYIIGTLALLIFMWVVLKFAHGDDQIQYTKSVFLLFAILVTIAVSWRGIIDYAYILSDCKTPQCEPPGLYQSHNFLPYVALISIAVSIAVWVITVYAPNSPNEAGLNNSIVDETEKKPKKSNRKIIYKYFFYFCIYMILCRLAWEIVDQITKSKR